MWVLWWMIDFELEERREGGKKDGVGVAINLYFPHALR
jgi:hypothetical protein